MRPLGQLVEAARRVEAGDYQQGVDISGGEEFEQLAHTFSSMQLSIREREARIVQQANHDALTTLSNRAALREYLHGVISHEPKLEPSAAGCATLSRHQCIARSRYR